MVRPQRVVRSWSSPVGTAPRAARAFADTPRRTCAAWLAAALLLCGCRTVTPAPDGPDDEQAAAQPLPDGRLYVQPGPPLGLGEGERVAGLLLRFQSARPADWQEAAGIIAAHDRRCRAEEDRWAAQGCRVTVRRRVPEEVLRLAPRATDDPAARQALAEWGAVLDALYGLLAATQVPVAARDHAGAIREALGFVPEERSPSLLSDPTAGRTTVDEASFQRQVAVLASSARGRELLLGTLIGIIHAAPDPRVQAMAVGGLAQYFETLAAGEDRALARREVKSVIALMAAPERMLDDLTLKRLAAALALVPDASLPWLLHAAQSSDNPRFLAHCYQALGTIGDARAAAVLLAQLPATTRFSDPLRFVLQLRLVEALGDLGEAQRARAADPAAARPAADELARALCDWLAAQPADEDALRARGVQALVRITGEPGRRTLDDWSRWARGGG